MTEIGPKSLYSLFLGYTLFVLTDFIPLVAKYPPLVPGWMQQISNFLLHQLTAALQCLPGHKELIAKLIFSTDFYHRLKAGWKVHAAWIFIFRAA